MKSARNNLRDNAQPLLPRSAFLSLGLRPFFLLAGVEALIDMVVWLAVYLHPNLWPAAAPLPAWLWHAHEMLFGFVAAAIAGFLLTAVPGWTGRAAVTSVALALLIAVWLAGRVVMLPATFLPPGIAAVVDLAFFPALLVTLAPPLVRARKWRNLPFIFILAALFLCNLLFHLGSVGAVAYGELIGLGLAIDIVLLLVVVVGGRVIPQFTRSGLKRTGIEIEITKQPWLDGLAIVSVVVVLASDVAVPHSTIAGMFALLAGLMQGLRLAQWQGWRTWRVPLVWVLHAGYAWLMVGLLLKGLWLMLDLPVASEWLHALTAGAFATMILAIMTRASLGHTGRPLVAPEPITLAYVLIIFAAIIRVFGTVLFASLHDFAIVLSGLCWIAAFIDYLWVFGPILVRPRVDARAA